LVLGDEGMECDSGGDVPDMALVEEESAAALDGQFVRSGLSQPEMVSGWWEHVVSVDARHPRSSLRSDSGGRHPKTVIMPPVSWGNCRVHCCSVVGDLAAELCQYHWDRGLDKRDKDDKPAVK
jgi:hypothetical protein